MGHATKSNVFESLGFSKEEAADLAMKVDLACEIRKFIERQNFRSQAKAAEFFGVPRPKINQITKNKLDGISIEYLIRMLTKTGGRLSYSFRQPSRQVAKKRITDSEILGA
jgi:predicted XRE-type DNA-binding protein